MTTAAMPQAAIDSTSRMKPRIIASRAEINMTPIRMMSRRVMGMMVCGLAYASGARGFDVFTLTPGRGQGGGTRGRARESRSKAVAKPL